MLSLFPKLIVRNTGEDLLIFQLDILNLQEYLHLTFKNVPFMSRLSSGNWLYRFSANSLIGLLFFSQCTFGLGMPAARQGRVAVRSIWTCTVSGLGTIVGAPESNTLAFQMVGIFDHFQCPV